jgi:hypothetical protein
MLLTCRGGEMLLYPLFMTDISHHTNGRPHLNEASLYALVQAWRVFSTEATCIIEKGTKLVMRNVELCIFHAPASQFKCYIADGSDAIEGKI